MAGASTGVDTAAISIGHLIASGFFGGPEKQIVELSSRLVASGWPVVIGSFRENRPSVEILEKAQQRGLPTFLLDTRSQFSPMAIGQLRRALRQHAVSLLVTHGYKANLIGRLATRGSATRQLPIVRGYTSHDAKVRLYERIDHRILHGCSDVLAVSAATRAMLAGHGLDPRKITVLHNAVDSELKVEPLDLRHEFSLPADSLVIVAAGRLSLEKGHRYLITAMQQLREREPRAIAVILGSGEQQGELEAQIAELGLAKHVILAGFRRDVLACLAGATLVVNPSLTEGLPNVVLEALSVRTPVVATAVGGVAELIEHGRDGWLVQAGDPTALAESILAALSDPARRAAVAAAGRERAVREFSFETQMETFQALCRRVLQRAR